jgi:hypothetical protein
MTTRPSAAAPILAVLAVALVTLGAYVGAYLFRGQVVPSPGKTRLRVFTNRLERSFFWPAMHAEGALTRLNVLAEYSDPDGTVTEKVYDASDPSDFAGDP